MTQPVRRNNFSNSVRPELEIKSWSFICTSILSGIGSKPIRDKVPDSTGSGFTALVWLNRRHVEFLVIDSRVLSYSCMVEYIVVTSFIRAGNKKRAETVSDTISQTWNSKIWKMCNVSYKIRNYNIKFKKCLTIVLKSEIKIK